MVEPAEGRRRGAPGGASCTVTQKRTPMATARRGHRPEGRASQPFGEQRQWTAGEQGADAAQREDARQHGRELRRREPCAAQHGTGHEIARAAQPDDEARRDHLRRRARHRLADRAQHGQHGQHGDRPAHAVAVEGDAQRHLRQQQRKEEDADRDAIDRRRHPEVAHHVGRHGVEQDAEGLAERGDGDEAEEEQGHLQARGRAGTRDGRHGTLMDGRAPAMLRSWPNRHCRTTALASASLRGSEASSATVIGFTGGRRR